MNEIEIYANTCMKTQIEFQNKPLGDNASSLIINYKPLAGINADITLKWNSYMYEKSNRF